MRETLFRFLLAFVRVFWRRPAIHGIEYLDLTRPAVLVANHLGSFGPIVLNAHLPLRLYPWVTHEVTDRRLCAGHLRTAFVEPELRLKPPLSGLVSKVIAGICVAVMEYIGAIPVYRQNRKIIETVDASVRALASGKHLLIFPEMHNAIGDRTVNNLDTGFLNIARALYRERGLVLRFYPVCVKKDTNAIRIGRPIAYDPALPFAREKRRIVGYLEQTLRMLHGYHAASAPPSRRQDRPIMPGRVSR